MSACPSVTMWNMCSNMYCYICGRRRVDVARYRMICLVLLTLSCFFHGCPGPLEWGGDHFRRTRDGLYPFAIRETPSSLTKVPILFSPLERREADRNLEERSGSEPWLAKMGKLRIIRVYLVVLNEKILQWKRGVTVFVLVHVEPSKGKIFQIRRIVCLTNR